MNKDLEPIYWQSNKEWWTIIDDKFVLTERAPARARASFWLYKGQNPNSREFSYYVPKIEEDPERRASPAEAGPAGSIPSA